MGAGLGRSDSAAGQKETSAGWWDLSVGPSGAAMFAWVDEGGRVLARYRQAAGGSITTDVASWTPARRSS